MSGKYYTYVKDILGNVVKLVDNNEEVASYVYDAWGNCTVYDKNGNITTDKNHIGYINPIRWKSQYYDVESGFYAINTASGTRYYDPTIRQYLSPLSPESMLGNAATIYGLNPYLLTIANPVNIGYNGYTIATNVELAYDPLELTAWQKFWQSGWGKGLAILLASTALVVCLVTGNLPAFLWAAGMTADSLLIGGTIAGFQSMHQGKGSVGAGTVLAASAMV